MKAILLVSLLASLVSAQQNVLVDGNSQLPPCAQQCILLQQANGACAATATPLEAWTCFCQSAYLTTLRSSAVGVCDSACTDPTQNAQISTWYNSNCGADNGASVHGADTANTESAPAADPAGDQTSTANSGDSSGSNSNADTASSNTGSNSTGSSTSNTGGDWWSNHYQWIIMVIILAIGFPLLAWLMIWLKRRHDRKQDMITGGFNAGITERSAPVGGNEEKNISRVESAVVPADGNGRDSPARTREAFMPYGYGYSRSDSRVNSSQAVNRPTSPLAAGATAENGGMGPWPAEASTNSISRRG